MPSGEILTETPDCAARVDARLAATWGGRVSRVALPSWHDRHATPANVTRGFTM